MEKRETIKYKGYKIKTYYDENGESPREWDNLGTIAYNHSRYNLGEEKIDDPIDWLSSLLDIEKEELYEIAEKNGIDTYSNEMLSHLFDLAKDQMVIMPLYLYDHSGLTISTSGFSCSWDSGQVGYNYCTLEKAIENWILPKDSTWDTLMDDWHYKGQKVSLRDATIRVLEGEIETFDQFLTGDVYGYDSGIHSCWGFYGEEGYKDMIAEAKSEIDYEIIKKRKEYQSKLKTLIRNRTPYSVRQTLLSEYDVPLLTKVS